MGQTSVNILLDILEPDFLSYLHYYNSILFCLQKLPITLPVLLRFIFLCISAIIVDVIVTPYFIIVAFPLIIAYYFLQYFFRFTSRELQRIDNITKSPIFSHFNQTISGLTTIRAFHEEEKFTTRLYDYIDINTLSFLMLNASNCWLGIALVSYKKISLSFILYTIN